MWPVVVSGRRVHPAHERPVDGGEALAEVGCGAGLVDVAEVEHAPGSVGSDQVGDPPGLIAAVAAVSDRPDDRAGARRGQRLIVAAAGEDHEQQDGIRCAKRALGGRGSAVPRGVRGAASGWPRA
jgi:hypothetical protein